MMRTIKSILSAAALILLSACASTSSSKQAPTTTPSATLHVAGASAAYKGAVGTGKGTLNYQGQVHHFTIVGLGAGGYGAQKVEATGEVYNLNDLADFPGTYKGISKGLTLINGKMHSKMTNGNGVVIYLTGERTGVATNTGVRTIVVKLTD